MSKRVSVSNNRLWLLNRDARRAGEALSDMPVGTELTREHRDLLANLFFSLAWLNSTAYPHDTDD